MEFRINVFGDFLTKSTIPSLCKELKNALNDADYNVVNYEAPVKVDNVSPIVKSGPAHCQSEDGPKWLQEQGVNVVSLANNHAMDYGEKAIRATIEAFKESIVLGAGTWEEAFRPVVFEKNDIKVALIALTHCEFGTHTDSFDEREMSKYGTAWINHPCVDSIVAELKKEVNYVVLLAHAGVENIEQPLPEWRERYKSLIDIGCDAVISSHPHIIQGYEEYKGHPIFYSLGNFYFPKEEPKKRLWYSSIMVTLSFSKEKMNYKYKPIFFDKDKISFDESEYTKEYIERILEVLNNKEAYLNYVNKKCSELLNVYDYMFYASGYFPLKSKKLLKKLLFFPYRLIKKTPTHMLNNIRCESHRWAIIRAIKIKNGIQ